MFKRASRSFRRRSAALFPCRRRASVTAGVRHSPGRRRYARSPQQRRLTPIAHCASCASQSTRSRSRMLATMHFSLHADRSYHRESRISTRMTSMYIFSRCSCTLRRKQHPASALSKNHCGFQCVHHVNVSKHICEFAQPLIFVNALLMPVTTNTPNLASVLTFIASTTMQNSRHHCQMNVQQNDRL